MSPKYFFELIVGGISRIAYPAYSDTLALNIEKVQGEEFFRKTLSSKLTFSGADYDYIVAQPFDTKFGVRISKTNDGLVWSNYWQGRFWKTDCEFDADSKTIKVTPSVQDRYSDILDNAEKEFNLVEILPDMTRVKAMQRTILQIYALGSDTLDCYMGGSSWEQEAKETTDQYVLQHTYAFSRDMYPFPRLVEISGEMTPVLPLGFKGNQPTVLTSGQTREEYTYDSNGFRFHYKDYFLTADEDPNDRVHEWEIIRISDSTRLWHLVEVAWAGAFTNTKYPVEVELQPENGATGTVKAYVRDMAFFTRYLMRELDDSGGRITSSDITEYNPNYKRAVGGSRRVIISMAESVTPTPYGKNPRGNYYAMPTLSSLAPIPIAQKLWGNFSFWADVNNMYLLIDSFYASYYPIPGVYSLADAIAALLTKIAPGITHAFDEAYSDFLYGDGAAEVGGYSQGIFIAPKSNAMVTTDAKPATKAPITFKAIADMLKQCFRCYWYIDELNRLHIEHIKYFINGGSYNAPPTVGLDLTNFIYPRNGKSWDYAAEQYSYDKPDMASQYNYAWMDSVTEQFVGKPLNIISGYVDKSKTEDIIISNFTSDIDFLISRPSLASKDGFALLGANLYTNTIRGEYGSGGLFFVQMRDLSLGRAASSPTQMLRYRVNKGDVLNIMLTVENLTTEAAYIFFFNGVDGIMSQTQASFAMSFDSTGQKTVQYIAPADGILGIQGSYNQLTLVSGISVETTFWRVEQLLSYDYHNMIQNAYLAVPYLQRYYLYDLPASQYSIGDGAVQTALGVKKLKKQRVKFPAIDEPNLLKLIRTNLGDGNIVKLSVNLSSRIADVTLAYDTE